MEILRRHSAMWNGSLGTINPTEHRIDLVTGTKLIRSISYRQGPAMRTKVAAEVRVARPRLRFYVDYRWLNTKHWPAITPYLVWMTA